MALSGIGQLVPSAAVVPVGSFITNLLRRLSYADPSLKTLKDSLYAMDSWERFRYKRGAGS